MKIKVIQLIFIVYLLCARNFLSSGDSTEKTISPHLCRTHFSGKRKTITNKKKINSIWLEVVSDSENKIRSVMSDSLQPHGWYSPWNSPGQNTAVGSLSFLQGIFPTQGSNPVLLHWRQILYQLSLKGRLTEGSRCCEK